MFAPPNASRKNAFPEITIRHAGYKQDWRNMSYVFAIAYDQKELEDNSLSFLQELKQEQRHDDDYRNDMIVHNRHKPDHHFLIADVPPHKVSYYIPDNGLAMAGFCEVDRETIFYDDKHKMDTLYIENLYTIKSDKCPVGKALMLECIAMAEKIGVEAIALNAPFDDSRKWYMQEIGFMPFDTDIFREKTDTSSGRMSKALLLHRTQFDQSKQRITLPAKRKKSAKPY